MFFSFKRYLPKFSIALILLFALTAANTSAQTKKISASQKKSAADAKKQTKQTLSKPDKSAKSKSDNSKDKSAKSKKEDSRDKSAKSKKDDSKSKKDSAKSKKEDLKDKSVKSKKEDSKKPSAAEKQRRAEEEARRRAEQEERRQAALAEQRRREQLAREAAARRLAFERGLRTETVENISKDNIEGEDLEVRAAALTALGNHAGTILVMEPQTGKVLSIVNQDWAIRHSFKPCSTIKLVTAVAGINEKVINETGNINNRRFPMNLDDALAFSNNSYFQTVGSGLGGEKMTAYAKMLGLGQPTGINAPNETGGRIPNGNNNARIYSHGDDFEVTPLQLGVLVSAISNGGKIVVPQIPRTKIEKANFRGAMRYQLDLPNNNFRNVIPGMVGAASYGTARRGMNPALAVAGKTGSCIGQGSWVGLFASVAPIENPKLAIIVITRGQGERGKYAAGIAANIYSALQNRVTPRGDNNLANLPLDLRPQMKVNAKTSAKIDVAEGEESEDNEATSVVKNQQVNTPVAPKSLIKKTGSSEPLFPTTVIKVKKPGETTRPRFAPNN